MRRLSCAPQAEFLFKKHCLWRQQGVAAAELPRYLQRELPHGPSLAAQIAALRHSPSRRTLLLRFFAGTQGAQDMLPRTTTGWAQAMQTARLAGLGVW